jgi:hypothetical protein
MTSRWTAIVIGFLLAALVLSSPYVDLRHLTAASYEGDSRLLIWTLAWDAHALLTGAPLLDANMFHPEREALAWAEHHLGVALFALPVYAATGNPVLSYWIVWLLAFPLNALAMSVLAFRITRDHVAAFAAGLVYAFCFFRMHHAHGHLQLLWTWALPLVPLALERWVARPSMARALVAAALVLLQALAGWYLAVLVALLSLVTIVFLLKARRVPLPQLLGGGLVAAIAAMPLLWLARPYTRLAAGSADEAAANAADLAAYLVPPENSWLGPVAAALGLTPRWIWGEQTLYVGGVTLAMAMIGILSWRRRDPLTAAVLVTGLAALLLSFGPRGGWSPFDALSVVPGMELFRAPARFALLVMFAMAVLVAIGTAHLSRRLGRAAIPVLTVLALLGLSESYVVGFPGGKPQPTPIPPVYQRLRTMMPAAVFSLPTYRGKPDAFRQSNYLLFSTAHWFPIVNGAGRQEPPGHGERVAAFSRFPHPDAIDRLREYGVKYVVLHTGQASELREAVARAQDAQGVSLLGEYDGDYLYEINATPPAGNAPPLDQVWRPSPDLIDRDASPQKMAKTDEDEPCDRQRTGRWQTGEEGRSTGAKRGPTDTGLHRGDGDRDCRH